MRKRNFKKTALKAGVFLVILLVLFFSGLAPVRAGFFEQASSYLSEGGKTFSDAAGKLGSGAVQVWQNVGNGLGEAAGVVANNTSRAGDAFLGGIKNFGETVGSLGKQATQGYDAALGKVKQGTDKAVEAVINVLPKKASVQIAAPKPAIKKDIQKPSAKEDADATEVKNLPTAPAVVQKEESKKQKTPVAPKEIIIYSNKANQESVQPLVASVAKAASASNAVFETVKSKGNVLVGEDVVIDASTGIATLKGIKIIGTVDFTGADVKGFKQTVVNNYSSGQPMVVYNSTTKENESWQTLSGNIGGVSTHWSVGKDLTVSQNANVASILTIGSTSANGSLIVNGTGSFTGAATFTGAITLSSGATMSGDLTVNGNTTLGDASGDTITINGRLSTLNISDGSTTSSLAKNSFYLGDTAGNGRGVFYIDSSGNTAASGTLNLSNTTLAVVSSTAANLRLATDGSKDLELWTNAVKRFYINSSGNTFASGTLQVTNTSTLYNDLLVGASTESIADAGFVFTGNDLYVHDKLGVNGISYFDAAIQASSTLLIGTAAGTDNFFVNGNNTYIVTSTAYGTAYSLVVGNGTTGALVAGGHAVPSHGSLYNLGSDSLRWSNIYSNTDNVSTTLYVGTGGTTLSTLTANNLAFAGSLGVVSSTAGNLRLAADGTNQIRFWTNGSQRAYIDSSGNTFASGTLQTTGSILTYANVTSTGHIYPATVNTVDLGGLNIAFRNIYASSSINVGASGTSSTFKGNYLALTDGTSSTILNGSSLTLGQRPGGYESGMFKVDSNGNVSASGTIKIATGSTSAPSLSFVNDTNNGFYNTADDIKVVINGVDIGDFSGLGLDANQLAALGSQALNLTGRIANGSTAIGVKIGNVNALSTAGAKIASFYSDYFITEKAYIDLTGEYSVGDGTTTSSFGTASIISGKTSGFDKGKFFVDSSGNVSASGSLKTFGNVTSTGHIYPATVNTADLGGLNIAFRDIYASSSINVGASGTSSTFMGNYLALTDGTSSTILNGSSLTLGQRPGGYESGMFKVDSNGNVSASGTIKIATGSTSAPSLSFVDDTNNGFFNTADDIKVVINGVVIGDFSGLGLDANRLAALGSQALNLTGRIANGSTAIGVKIGNVNALSTAGAKIASFYSDYFITEKAYIDIAGAYNVGNGTATSTFGANIITSGVATNFNLGKFYIDSSGNVSATGSILTYANVTSTGHIYPATVNTVDLGGLNIAFRNIYASSSINVGASGTSSTFKGNYLAMTDGASSTILNGSSFKIGVGTNYNDGAFAVDSQGKVSTSGSLQIFGNDAAQGTNSATGGFIIYATDSTTTLQSNASNAAGSAGFAFLASNMNVVSGGSSSTDRMLAVFQTRDNGVVKNKVTISAGGNVYAKNSFIANSTDYGIGDVAEYVNLTAGEIGEPGDVLVVDLVNPNHYKKSSAAYSKEIAGVISDTGAFIMGASGEGRAALALAGLVKTKVTDENGQISVGDYLVSASKPGYAMKYDSALGKAAGLVGMALEPLTEGDGKITIMVNKGLVAGSNSAGSLTVGENGNGTLSGGENWDLGGKSILNVKSISGANGFWFIDEKGLLMAKEIKADKVQAKKFVVEKENDLKKASVGEATISQNNSIVVVENELITPKVKIFITFRSNPQSFWWISKQENGKFEVALSKETKDDLIFDYWIVGVEEAPALELEVAPAVPVAPLVEPPAVPAVEAAVVVPAPVAPEAPSATPEAVVEAPAAEPAPVEQTPVAPAAVSAVEPAPEANTPAAAESAPVESAPVPGEVSNP